MADKLISSLTAATSIASTDLLVIETAAGNSRKVTGANASKSFQTLAGYEAGPLTIPTSADLATWDNQGTSTVTDGSGSLILAPQVDNVIHGRYKSGTPTDIYCRVELDTLSTNSTGTSYGMVAGILMKDTATSNKRLLWGLQIYNDATGGDDTKLYDPQLTRWSGASPPVFSTTSVSKYSLTPWKWLRVNNNGTTLTLYVSKDGRDWTSVGTETLAAYIGAVGSYGVGSYGDSGCTAAYSFFSYFGTTAPS